MTTQKQIIIRYLQEVNDWQPAFKLRGLNTPFGFLGHQADRRCRELASEGKIEHKIEGAYAYYRSKPIQYQVYKVLSDTGQVERELKLAI